MINKKFVNKVKEAIDNWNSETDESKPFPQVMLELEEMYEKLDARYKGTYINMHTGKEEDITRTIVKS